MLFEEAIRRVLLRVRLPATGGPRALRALGLETSLFWGLLRGLLVGSGLLGGLFEVLGCPKDLKETREKTPTGRPHSRGDPRAERRLRILGDPEGPKGPRTPCSLTRKSSCFKIPITSLQVQRVLPRTRVPRKRFMSQLSMRENLSRTSSFACSPLANLRALIL